MSGQGCFQKFAVLSLSACLLAGGSKGTVPSEQTAKSFS